MNITKGMELIKDGVYGFIYITTNNANGKMYIGQKRIDKRNVWKKYIGSGVNITRAIAKYGRACFTKEIVDVAFNQKELNEKEKIWIEKFNATKSERFYNITKGGEQGFSYVDYYADRDPNWLEEYNERRCSPQRYKIAKYDKDGNYICSYDGLTAAAQSCNGGASHICSVCKGDRPYAYGYVWKYIGGNYSDKRIGNTKNHNPQNKIAVYQYDLNGVFIDEYESIQDATRSLGKTGAHILQTCRGERQQCQGYMWRFADGNKNNIAPYSGVVMASG